MLAAYQHNRVLIIVCITLGAALGALSICGYGVNHLDIAPQYASITMGLSNTVATIPGIISPLIAGFIVTDQKVIVIFEMNQANEILILGRGSMEMDFHTDIVRLPGWMHYLLVFRFWSGSTLGKTEKRRSREY